MPTSLTQDNSSLPVKWMMCIALSILAATATYWPHALQALRYDRQLVFSGEIWRLATAHLVHLNMPHLVMNLLALLLLCELLWRGMEIRRAVGLLVFSALGVSILLLALHPELSWYAGLSGALHGVWAGCALHEIKAVGDENRSVVSLWERWPMPRRLSALALALLCLKLALEYRYGPSQRTVQAIGGEVIAVSHAYGALSGLAYFLGWRGIALLRFRLK